MATSITSMNGGDSAVGVGQERPPEDVEFMRQAHAAVGDLLTANPVRYYVDFLLTTAVAYATLFLYLTTEPLSAVQLAAFVVCGLAIYRAAVFTHEIVHGRAPWFRRFEVLWNVLCGIPLLLPSFFYGDHKGHHVKGRYSTRSDPEYLLHGSASRLRILAFLALPWLYPVLPPLRFLLLTPVALLSEAVDRIVWRFGSSLYNMNEGYWRQDDPAARSRDRWLQEIACCAWAWIVAALFVSHQAPWTALGKLYLLSVFWMSLNQVRTLASHRYTNRANAPIGHVEQLRDTCTFARGVLLPYLWAPVGMRYHALHHLMPAMPYHALGAAHRRLLAQLPPDSPYHETLVPGLGPALCRMLFDRSARSSGRAPSAVRTHEALPGQK